MVSQKLQLENKAIELYKTYTRALHRRPAKNPKETENWKFFCKAIDLFGSREEYDARSFIEALFKKYDKIYPPQLCTMKSWNDFIEYKGTISNTTHEEDVLSLFSKLASDYKAIIAIMKSRNIKDLPSALADPYCIEMMARGGLDKSFLMAFSKKYTQENVDTSITIKKVILYRNSKIKSFLKKVFGDDLYIEDIKKYLEAL